MPIRELIKRKLTETLMPQRLRIIDESDHHHGHAGADPRGGSHFRLVIVSERFNGLSRLARQRVVYDLLASELCGRIHALSMQTLTPKEEAETLSLSP